MKQPLEGQKDRKRHGQSDKFRRNLMTDASPLVRRREIAAGVKRGRFLISREAEMKKGDYKRGKTQSLLTGSSYRKEKH